MPISRRIFCLQCGAALFSWRSLAEVSTSQGAQGNPIPMPTDRAEDSFTIYSLLIPVLQPTKKEYLVAETTEDLSGQFQVLTPAAQTKPPYAPIDIARLRIDPLDVPDDWKVPFQEAVADYQRNKEVRVRLEPKLRLPLPYRLLDSEQVKEYKLLQPPHITSPSHPWPPDPKLVKKYKGRGPLSLVSEVYFDHARTLGLVWAVSGCMENWYAFEKQNSQWLPAAWKDRGSCVEA